MRRSIAPALVAGLLLALGAGPGEAQTIWDKLKKRKHERTHTRGDRTHHGAVDVERRSTGYRNEDGSLTVTGSGTATGKEGHVLEGGHETTIRRTGDGHQWKSESGWNVGDLGGRRSTTGQSRKTDSGSEWTKTTTVQGKNGWGKNVQSKGRWVKNPDGSMKWVTDKVITRKDGTVIKEQSTLGLRKTDQGWKWSLDSQRDGPAGRSNFSGDLTSRKNADGKTSWKTNARGKGPWGKGWNARGEGSRWKDRDGNWKWRSNSRGQTGGGLTFGADKKGSAKWTGQGWKVNSSSKPKGNWQQKMQEAGAKLKAAGEAWKKKVQANQRKRARNKPAWGGWKKKR